jgi:hypothetical protein
MPIKTYKIERPDSDGDCSIDLVFEIENSHDDDILLIKYDAFHMNEAGHLIATDTRNSNQCFLEKGDAEEITGWGRIHERYLASGKSVNVQVQAQLFRREFFKIGPYKIPDGEGVIWIAADIESKIIDNHIKISMTRFPPDEDGDERVEFMGLLKNKTGAYLEDVELKASLLDRSGAEFDSTSGTNNLPPHCAASVEPSLWGMKKNKLKGATVELTITIYDRIGAEIIESSVDLPR